MSGANYATGIVTRWGTATDLPVPGDYDGDRRTDIAYYRPSTGIWSILTSSTNYTKHVDVLLGAARDVPVPGDFDGDGLTDVAVYSPAQGNGGSSTSTSHYTAETVIVFGARRRPSCAWRLRWRRQDRSRCVSARHRRMDHSAVEHRLRDERPDRRSAPAPMFWCRLITTATATPTSPSSNRPPGNGRSGLRAPISRPSSSRSLG